LGLDCVEGGLGLEIILDSALPGMPAHEAEALIKKAYHICPYSKAMRNNVAVKLGLIETRRESDINHTERVPECGRRHASRARRLRQGS
jgi:hypothetical protein